MKTVRTVGLSLAIAAVGLAGCSTVRSARDRIVQPASLCETRTVQIYFENDSAEVTREGRAVISEAAAAARSCVVGRVQVLGLADAVGAPGVNMELSKRRAQSVTAALASAGLPAAEFQVAAAGQTGATTLAGQAAPLRRRADVVLHLTPR